MTDPAFALANLAAIITRLAAVVPKSPSVVAKAETMNPTMDAANTAADLEFTESITANLKIAETNPQPSFDRMEPVLSPSNPHQASMIALPYTTTFVLASAMLAIAPGPDILYVLAKGISQGRRAAIVAAVGFCSGLTIHTAASVCGLSALLIASATAFTFMKLLGAAYLVYLGIGAIFSRSLIALPENTAPVSSRKIFAQAFLMNLLNPKVALFFLAFLPQFVSADQGSVPVQLFLLGFGFGIISFAVFSFAGLFSATIGQYVRTRPVLTRLLDCIAGTAFILLGLRLAVFGHTAQH